jgi:hypothetical protein
MEKESKVSDSTYVIKRVLAFFLMLWSGYSTITRLVGLVSFSSYNLPGWMFPWTLLWAGIWGFVCYKSYLVFRGKI